MATLTDDEVWELIKWHRFRYGPMKTRMLTDLHDMDAESLAELIELRKEVAGLRETVEILSDTDLVQQIAKSVHDVADGRVVSQDDVEREV